MNHVCYQCHESIQPGLAVIRTLEFERVAFHRDCWALRLVPAQRRPGDGSVSRTDP